MSEYVVVEADGASRGNPGPASYGAVVFDPVTGAVLAERSEAIGVATNNVGEYRGLIAGLTAAGELGARQIGVRMDSKLVVEQMKGVWQVKHPGLRELAKQAVALCQQFDDVSFEWVPREQNKHADRLANEALDRAAGKPVRAPRSAPAPVPAAQPSWTPPSRGVTRLVLVRHGSTEHSAERRFSGRNELPLNDVGRKQAGQLAARAYGEIAAVVSSPLRRAVETAEAIAGARGLQVETVDDFIETDFGAWEGLTLAETFRSAGEAVRNWQASHEMAPPGGESFAAVGDRVQRARADVVARFPESTVVVVTHVTPIKLLVCGALEAPPSALFRLYLDTGSVSVVDYAADGTASVRLVNDTCHLA